MTWLARLSVTNRAIVGLVTVLVIAFGVMSTTSLRQELLPSLDLPVVTVVTPYPGASPAVVEQQVTEPIEAAVGKLAGVTDTRSTSTGGTSVVTLNLKYGTDLDAFATQAERATQGARLPTDVTPTVVSGGTDSLPVVQLAVSSDLPADQVAAILRDRVQPLLGGLDGVGDVSLSGISANRVTIDLDAAALATRGISPTAVTTLLQQNGVRVPAGQLTPDTDPVTVEVGSPVTTLDQIRDLYLTPTPTAGAATGARPGAPVAPPAPVRLGDVATIGSAPAPATGYTRTNGTASIGISIAKKEGGNTVTVSHTVADALPQVTDALGGAAQNAQATVVFDQAPFIEQSVEDLTTEGLLGLLFAVLVILGFLLSVRATLVTAVSIPLSVLIAMIVLNVGGYTLNILTLGALTVAIGRVVDDSIVVIENIKRHMGYGGPRRAAILTAVREVAGAITASTITTVAVFAPIGLVGGQVGELFRPFAVTVTAALLASLVVSLTVVPVLASLVMRKPRHPEPEPTFEPGVTPVRTRLQRGYLPLLTSAIGRPLISLGIAVAILIGTFALVPLMKTSFLGDSGGNTLSVRQELEPGTGLPQADTAAKNVEQVLAATPGIASYQVTVGSPAGGAGGFAGLARGASTATRFAVTFETDADATAVADDLRARLVPLGTGSGTLTVQGGQGGFGNDQLAVDVTADDATVLAQAADQVQQAVAAIPGAVEVRNNLAAAQPVLDVAVDRRKAADAGLTETQIGQAVATALRGSTVGTLTIGGVEQDVVLRTGTAPADLAALQALPLTGTRGPLALRDVATVTQTSTAPSIGHTDGARSAQITARPAANDLGAVTADLRKALDGLRLPAGATAQIGGVSQQQSDAFAQLGIALLLAIAVVYLVMVVTFRSLLQPLLLLVAIPFAATGALGLLLITGTPLGVPALIGMLMLIGIVVTNAIVLIDLVNQYRRRGRGLYESVTEGAAQRLRPILMTAVATIFALLPMAFGLTGGGGFISQPLAIVVIGGLVSSTLLTLVLVPVLYVLVERLRGRRGARAAAGESMAPEPVVALAENAGPEPERVLVSASAAGQLLAVETVSVPALLGAPAAVSAKHAGPAVEVLPVSVPVSAEHVESAPEPAPAGPAVWGKLTDLDGFPLIGAVLSVFDPEGVQRATTASGASGRFAVVLPAAGEYLLVGQFGGREPTVEWVQAPVQRDLRIEGPAAVAGTIHQVSGAGVAALITMVDLAGERVAGTRSDDAGRYRMGQVPSGELHLVVALPGGPSVAKRVSVPRTGTVRCDVTVPASGVLTGTVRSGLGRAVGDAVATVTDETGAVVATGRTAPDGSFRMTGLPDGAYTVTATPGTPAVRAIRVRDGAETTAELELGDPVAMPRHAGNGHAH